MCDARGHTVCDFRKTVVTFIIMQRLLCVVERVQV